MPELEMHDDVCLLILQVLHSPFSVLRPQTQVSRLRLWNQWLNVPNAIRILDDASITRKEAHPTDAGDALADPLILILVGLVDERMRSDVAAEIIADQVVVPMISDRVDQSRESALIAKHARPDGFKHFGESRIDFMRSVVVLMPKVLDVLGQVAEQKDVGFADFAGDFNLSR